MRCWMKADPHVRHPTPSKAAPHAGLETEKVDHMKPERDMALTCSASKVAILCYKCIR